MLITRELVGLHARFEDELDLGIASEDVDTPADRGVGHGTRDSRAPSPSPQAGMPAIRTFARRRRPRQLNLFPNAAIPSRAPLAAHDIQAAV